VVVKSGKRTCCRFQVIGLKSLFFNSSGMFWLENSVETG